MSTRNFTIDDVAKLAGVSRMTVSRALNNPELVNETTLGQEGVRTYHRWLRDAIAADRPMDQVVRDLLMASTGPAPGPASNFYRAVSGPRSTAT